MDVLEYLSLEISVLKYSALGYLPLHGNSWPSKGCNIPQNVGHFCAEIFSDGHVCAEIFSDGHFCAEIFSDGHFCAEIFSDGHVCAEIFSDGHVCAEIFSDGHFCAGIFSDGHFSAGIFNVEIFSFPREILAFQWLQYPPYRWTFLRCKPFPLSPASSHNKQTITAQDKQKNQA